MTNQLRTLSQLSVGNFQYFETGISVWRLGTILDTVVIESTDMCYRKNTLSLSRGHHHFYQRPVLHYGLEAVLSPLPYPVGGVKFD